MYSNTQISTVRTAPSNVLEKTSARVQLRTGHSQFRRHDKFTKISIGDTLVPLRYITNDGGILPVVLSDPPESESRVSLLIQWSGRRSIALWRNSSVQRHTSRLPDFLSELPDFLSELPDFLSQLPDFLSELPDFLSELPDFLSELPDFLPELPDFLSKLP